MLRDGKRTSRCVLLPVTDITDLGDETRPMANADFMAEAKRMYEAQYPKKKFDDLAYSTKKKWYYKAMKDWEDRTGQPAYSQVKGRMSFRDYFLQMSEQQKRDWLGPEKYKLWQTGKYDIKDFIPPYPQKAMTVKQLKELDKASFGNDNTRTERIVRQKPTFIDAKDIKEATEYTKNHIAGNVKWNNIDVETVNIINKEMRDLQSQYRLLELRYDTVGTNARMKHVAWANDRLLEVNPRQVTQEAVKQELELHRNRSKAGNFSRWTVDSSLGSFDRYIRGVITHESGHSLLYRKGMEEQRLAGKVKKHHWLKGDIEVFKISLEDTQSYKLVESTFAKAKANGDIFKISEYGKKNMHEFFAECFSMYRFEKTKLPDYITAMIEEIAK